MGGAVTRLQKVWVNMRRRCNQPTAENYADYGERGITVAPDWEVFSVFEKWALANGYKGGLILDRRDNDGGYCPENCRFVNAKVSMNNRRSLRLVTAFGETKNVTQWSEDARCVVPKHTVYSRLNLGWQPEVAITTSRYGKPQEK